MLKLSMVVFSMITDHSHVATLCRRSKNHWVLQFLPFYQGMIKTGTQRDYMGDL